MNRALNVVLQITILTFSFSGFAFAQTPAQQTGGLQRMERDIDTDERIKERIERPKDEEEEREDILEEERVPIEGEKKVLTCSRPLNRTVTSGSSIAPRPADILPSRSTA